MSLGRMKPFGEKGTHRDLPGSETPSESGPTENGRHLPSTGPGWGRAHIAWATWSHYTSIHMESEVLIQSQCERPSPLLQTLERRRQSRTAPWEIKKHLPRLLHMPRALVHVGPSEVFDLLSWSSASPSFKIPDLGMSPGSGGLGAGVGYSNESDVFCASLSAKNIFLAFAICGSMLPLPVKITEWIWVARQITHIYGYSRDYNNLPSPNICPMIRCYQDVLGWDSYSERAYSPSLTCSPYSRQKEG